MQDPKWMQWPILSAGVVMKAKISTKMWSWFSWTFTIFMLWERACVKSEICKIFFFVKSKQNITDLSDLKKKLLTNFRCFPVIDDIRWLSNIDNTQWLHHLHCILHSAVKIADTVSIFLFRQIKARRQWFDFLSTNFIWFMILLKI